MLTKITAGLANATSGTDFCTWTANNLQATPTYVTTGNSLFTSLGNCYPSTARAVGVGLGGLTNSMAILEQTANEIKNTAFYDGERQFIPSLPTAVVRSLTTTWPGYCPQKQVAVIRAAAGIPSFLNQVGLVILRNIFSHADCVSLVRHPERGVFLKNISC